MRPMEGQTVREELLRRADTAIAMRILAETDPERLERWVERAIVATSVAEVIDPPS